jgi:hypothetical protein
VTDDDDLVLLDDERVKHVPMVWNELKNPRHASRHVALP